MFAPGRRSSRLSLTVLAPLFVIPLAFGFAACGTETDSDLFGVPPGSPTADAGGGKSDGATVPPIVGRDGGGDPLDSGTDADATAPLVVGLDARPANATCKAFTPPPTSGQVRLVDRFPNVPLTTPTGIFQRPGDNTRWYVSERAGRIVHFPNNPNAGAADTRVALDLRTVTYAGTDCSMAGIAFPSDFATSKRAYVGYCYRGPETTNRLQIRVSRFASTDGGATFDPASEQVVVALDFPHGDGVHTNVGLHAGNALRFGRDGYLYVAIGDGGPQGSIGGHQAQDTNDLRGKLLRVDVRDLTKSLPKDFVLDRQRVAVDIPPDNPFVAGGGHPAVYAYGFRNPWQWTFDRQTGEIWLGDVGNTLYEEVNRRVQKGGNYGWGVLEGFNCTNYFGAPACADPTLIKPLLSYRHGDLPQQGNAVTGGVVYRGSAVPSLAGAYIFGDSSKGRIWTVRNADTVAADPPPEKELLFSGMPVSSFGEDQEGEVYLTVLYGAQPGRVMMLEEAPAAPGPQPSGPPALLSETGCFVPTDPATPLPALVPFAPTAELWSDGAAKRRWLALPDTQKITVKDDGDFDLPPGSVLVKEFSLGATRVETRFLVRQEADGRWAGYTYQWNEAQTDATLVGAASTQATIGTQVWTFPGRADCLQCHTKVAGTTLGLELAQLNRDLLYPATGRTANQLRTLAHIGLFAADLPDALPSLTALDDTTKTVTDRARGYLHANCSHCHRPDGPTFTPLDLRYPTTFGEMGICDAPPTIDDLTDFIPSAPRLFAPGDPNRSVLYWRMATVDARVRMPPLARSLTHTAAVDVVSSWIQATTTCP